MPMAASGLVPARACESGDDGTFVILDCGATEIAAAEIRKAIRHVQDGEIDEIARDRNSVCYRVPLGSKSGATEIALVKVPRPGPHRTNSDATFSGEATIIARLPEAGVGCAYRLLARARLDEVHFLLTTYIPGDHPDPRHHPLDERRLEGLFDTLFTMDCQGLMHYDLKPQNILFDSDRHGLIDFEFARFEPWHDAYAKTAKTYCEDYNASPNPHFPGRTNVANFEFRTLSAYLNYLARVMSDKCADDILSVYLQAKSRYYARIGHFLAELPAESTERLAAPAGIAPRDAARRLGDAAAFSERLAVVLRAASKPIREIERALMDFRRHVFERRRQEAHQCRLAAFDRLRRESFGTTTLPTDYLDSMDRTFDLVWRSR